MNILNDKIESANSICILGHQNPDGDCIGSALSIYNYIINKYNDKKNVKVYLEEFSNKFLMFKNADKISSDFNDATKYDLAIAVDVSNKERFSNFCRYFDEAKDTLVFDHHENNVIVSPNKIVNEKSIATAEILYDYFDKEFIDKSIAECLYIAIATDSGVFRYNDTSKKTFLIVGDLISYGIDFKYILDEIVFNNTLNQRKAQGIVFDRLKLISNGRVAFSYILQEELDNLNIDKKCIDNIIVYLREIYDIKLAAFAYPVGKDIYKFSLRSKFSNINVADFARNHDGGGHALAAGCLYYGNITNVEKNFLDDVTKFLSDK